MVDLVVDKVPRIARGLVEALGENNSLLSLAFSNTVINEDNWTVLCQSLAGHSKLVRLRLHHTFPHEPAGTCTERKVLRDNAFLQMLQANTALQELDARDESSDPRDEFDEDTLSDVILPYLQSLRTFAGPDPSLDLFVHALSTVGLDNLNLAWMLIRSNLPTIL